MSRAAFTAPKPRKPLCLCVSLSASIAVETLYHRTTLHSAPDAARPFVRALKKSRAAKKFSRKFFCLSVRVDKSTLTPPLTFFGRRVVRPCGHPQTVSRRTLGGVRQLIITRRQDKTCYRAGPTGISLRLRAGTGARQANIRQGHGVPAVPPGIEAGLSGRALVAAD